MELDEATAQRYQLMVKATKEDLQLMHENYNEGVFNEVSDVYVEALDKEGFIYELDKAWKWAGYSRKADAKRLLTGARGSLGLQENRDYKILGAPGKRDGNKEAGRGGDRRSEKILMTRGGFRKFLIGSPRHAVVNFLDRVWAEADRYANESADASTRRATINQQFVREMANERKEKKMHDIVKRSLAVRENGREELACDLGVVDVETKSEAIEVKHVADWKHALGQAQAYGFSTGKRPRVHLFGGKLTSNEEEVFKRLKVNLTYEQI